MATRVIASVSGGLEKIFTKKVYFLLLLLNYSSSYYMTVCRGKIVGLDWPKRAAGVG